MINQLVKVFHGGWMLLRLVAVISSSIATILSSLLPLYLNSPLPAEYLFRMLIFLSIAAIIVHGFLTHLFNDYSDYRSGTDAYSPAILSGGSRVIQKGLITPQAIWQIGKWLSIMLILLAVIMMVVGRYELTVLLIIGFWAAASYSLPPLRLSYRPFLGEWFSLFPAVFFLGVAGPWIILGTIPLWATQNAVINALVCMGWVMIHHIPDLDADRQAIPMKRTTVVWFADKFGVKFACLPAFLYIFLAGLCAFWLGTERLSAALLLGVLISGVLFLIIKMNPKDLEQVTNYEKVLLLIAIIVAVILGVF